MRIILNKIKNRTYYTLDEFITIFEDSEDLKEKILDGISLGKPYKSNNKTILKLIAEELFNEDVLVTDQDIFNDDANLLFCKYIAPKYLDYSIGYTDDYENLNTEKIKVFKEFFRKYTNIYYSTYDKYLPLITNYTNKKADLISKLESETITDFNDTPQSASPWTDSQIYISNTSKSKTSVDADNIPNQLSNIENKIHNYYDNWVKEFKGLFEYV